MNARRFVNASCTRLSFTISAVLIAAAASAAQSAQPGSQPSMDALRAACTADAQRLCAGVQPGGGRIVACLKDHKDALSDRCKQAAGLPANPASNSAPGPVVASP